MIEKVTNGSIAKNKKLNEVIAAVNSLIGMTVREGSSAESPKLVFGERNSELITTGGGTGDGDGGGGGVPEGYVETAVTLCQNGSPVTGTILFKPDA